LDKVSFVGKKSGALASNFLLTSWSRRSELNFPLTVEGPRYTGNFVPESNFKREAASTEQLLRQSKKEILGSNLGKESVG